MTERKKAMANLTDFKNAKEYIEYMRSQKENKPMTDSEIKKIIIEKTEYYIDLMLAVVGLSRSQFNAVMKFEHDFSLRGHTGGQFQYYTYGKIDSTLRWNLDIVKMNDSNEYFNRTVPHEVAHMIIQVMFRQKLFGSRKPQTHGREWKMLMAKVGADNTRCHKYETKSARKVKRFIYKAECGCEGEFTAQRHKRQQDYLSGKYVKKYSVCMKHKNLYKFTGRIETLG